MAELIDNLLAARDLLVKAVVLPSGLCGLVVLALWWIESRLRRQLQHRTQKVTWWRRVWLSIASAVLVAPAVIAFVVNRGWPEIPPPTSMESLGVVLAVMVPAAALAPVVLRTDFSSWPAKIIYVVIAACLAGLFFRTPATVENSFTWKIIAGGAATVLAVGLLPLGKRVPTWAVLLSMAATFGGLATVVELSGGLMTVSLAAGAMSMCIGIAAVGSMVLRPPAPDSAAGLVVSLTAIILVILSVTAWLDVNAYRDPSPIPFVLIAVAPLLMWCAALTGHGRRHRQIAGIIAAVVAIAASTVAVVIAG